jgi:tetratricopeptide (TPR) repeat protein
MKKGIFILILLVLNSYIALPQQNVVDSLISLLEDSLSGGNAELLNEISQAYGYFHQKKSLEFARKAKIAALSESDNDQLAVANRNIGGYFNTKFQIDSAKRYYRRSLHLYQSMNDVKGQAQIINLLGILYGKDNKYDSAFVNFNKALEIAQDIQDSMTLTMVYTNLGLVYYHWGDYEEAVKYYELAQEINLALNIVEGLEKNYYNMGKIAFKWDKTELALDYYSKTLEILRKLGSKVSIANVYIDIGNAHNRLKNQDSALYYYHQAYTIAKEFDSKRIMSIALVNIGNRLRAAKDYEKAFNTYLESYDILKGTKDKKRQCEVLQAIGDIFRRTGQYDSSLVYLTKSLEMSEELRYRDQKQTIYLNLYHLYKEKEDYKKALEYYIDYSRLKDTLFNESSRKELAEFEAKYHSEKQTSKIKILEKEKEIGILELRRQKMQKYFLIALAVLIVLVGLLLFNRYQLRQKNYRQQKEFQTQAMEQRLLRAQMNPHFIFNSLNAIQSFISENNPETAGRFLGKFADLIRYNLESTRNAFVPLEHEIQALRNNLELERIRFNHSFDFKIVIDETIDPVNITIPPLLIQPFVENSIIHGLATVESGGLLELEFRRNGNSIDAIIIDNGIGRAKSALKRKEKGVHKKSLGTQLIKERLDLYNKQGKTNSSFQIIDLFDENKKNIGTKVLLNIPCELKY